MTKLGNKAPAKEPKESVVKSVSVDRVKYDKSGNLRFSLTVNDVQINGCTWREGTTKDGKEYAMVGFPSYKNGDKFYNNAYVYLTEEDTENINKLLAEALANAEE